MAEEFYKGHDCTKEALRRSRTDKKTGTVTYYYRPLRLERTHIVAGFGETVMLYLLHSHADCDDVCYSWKQMMGGGYLIENHGPAVGYVMPDTNKECENSASINVYCGQKRLDTAYISVSRPGLVDVAYGILSGKIYAEEHTGTKIQVGPGRWVLAKEYLRAAYYMFYYNCDGVFLYRKPTPGVRKWGTGPPIDALKEAFGEIVGRVYDYRTGPMKKMMCCPPKLVEVKYEKMKGY